MLSVDALHRADLDEALQALQEEVRKAPGEARLRTFLFQLFAVCGQWERALTQLNVVRELDDEALLMAQTYQELLQCEVLRSEVFAGKRTPLIFGEPDPWVAKAIEAFRLAANEEWTAAASMREEAWEEAPASSGTVQCDAGGEALQTTEFAWIADSDMRLGPMLEAIVDGRYYWIPFNRIARVEFDPPTDLRDFVWTPARFVWANQGQSVGMIPTRYPGSEGNSDSAIRLARKSHWTEPAPGFFTGLGQREWATDVGDFALLNVRHLTLNAP